MEIDAALPGYGEQRGRKDLPVGCGDQHVGLQSTDHIEAFRSIDVLGLQHEDATCLSRLLDQARYDLLLATLRPVGLSDKGDHVMPALLDQMFECGKGEVTRSQHHQSKRRIHDESLVRQILASRPFREMRGRVLGPQPVAPSQQAASRSFRQREARPMPEPSGARARARGASPRFPGALASRSNR